MSRESWNTAAACCEDMPQKSLDIRFSDHPYAQVKVTEGDFRLDCYAGFLMFLLVVAVATAFFYWTGFS